MSAFAKEFSAGWREVVGAMIGIACGFTGFSPLQSFFFRALELDFGWSKTAAAISLIALPITALFLPVAGLLLDRFGVRRVALFSTLAFAACFILLSAMNGQLGMFYAAFIALSVLGIATGPISYTRAVATRFQASRGTALAIALLGSAIAGMILPQALAAVFASGGWRAGYQFMAIWALVGGVLAVLMIRPSDQGEQSTGVKTGDSIGEAVRTVPFWVLGVAIFCVSLAGLGFISQLQSIVIEKGFAPERAPLILSVLAAAVFTSRLVVGWALDTFSAERVAGISFALAGVGMLVWMFGDPTLMTAILGTMLLGLCIGAELDFMSFFCARLFGLLHYGAVYGALSMFFYTGAAAGGITFGVIHDRMGAYSAALAVATTFLFVAAILFLTLRSASIRAIQATNAGMAPHARGAT